MLRIVGNQILTIPKTNKSKIVFFDYCGDVHPVELKDCPVFDAEVVVFLRCNENFLYYWLKSKMFPNLKTIYTDMLCADEIYKFKNLEVYCSNDYIYNKFQSYHDVNHRNTGTRIFPIDVKHIETLTKILGNIE